MFYYAIIFVPGEKSEKPGANLKVIKMSYEDLIPISNICSFRTLVIKSKWMLSVASHVSWFSPMRDLNQVLTLKISMNTKYHVVTFKVTLLTVVQCERWGRLTVLLGRYSNETIRNQHKLGQKLSSNFLHQSKMWCYTSNQDVEMIQNIRIGSSPS